MLNQLDVLYVRERYADLRRVAARDQVVAALRARYREQIGLEWRVLRRLRMPGNRLQHAAHQLYRTESQHLAR